MEKPDLVAQKRQQLLNFIAAHPEIFSRQGSVQSSERTYQGKRLGPFFRLVFRSAGRLRSVYIGGHRALASEIAQVLRDLQAPLRQGRGIDRRLAEVWKDFQEGRRAFRQRLEQCGLCLKGNEIRGWRAWRGAAQTPDNVHNPEAGVRDGEPS